MDSMAARVGKRVADGQRSCGAEWTIGTSGCAVVESLEDWGVLGRSESRVRDEFLDLEPRARDVTRSIDSREILLLEPFARRERALRCGDMQLVARGSAHG